MDIIEIIGLALILALCGWVAYGFFKKNEVKRYEPKPCDGKVVIDPQPEPADGPSPPKPIRRKPIVDGDIEIFDEEEIQPEVRGKDIK